MKETIEPCPYCGESLRLDLITEEHKYGYKWIGGCYEPTDYSSYIKCLNCEAQSPRLWLKEGIIGRGETRQKALEYWNAVSRRVNPAGSE